jgi:hypothetical protein
MPQREIRDDVLGTLRFDQYWTRPIEVTMLGRQWPASLLVRGELEQAIDDEQRQAFRFFGENHVAMLADGERALLEYYQAVAPEYRASLGTEEGGRILPMVSEPQELAAMLTLSHVILPWSFSAGERVVGLLFECKWEPEHGLGLKDVNERVVDVGFQDLVL